MQIKQPKNFINGQSFYIGTSCRQVALEIIEFDSHARYQHRAALMQDLVNIFIAFKNENTKESEKK